MKPVIASLFIICMIFWFWHKKSPHHIDEASDAGEEVSAPAKPTASTVKNQGPAFNTLPKKLPQPTRPMMAVKPQITSPTKPPQVSSADSKTARQGPPANMEETKKYFEQSKANEIKFLKDYMQLTPEEQLAYDQINKAFRKSLRAAMKEPTGRETAMHELFTQKQEAISQLLGEDRYKTYRAFQKMQMENIVRRQPATH